MQHEAEWFTRQMQLSHDDIEILNPGLSFVNPEEAENVENKVIATRLT